jgi:hypothetical protein
MRISQLLERAMQDEVVAIVVRRKRDGWDWALRDVKGRLRTGGHAATQDAAMAEGWRHARQPGPSRAFPELIVEPLIGLA